MGFKEIIEKKEILIDCACGCGMKRPKYDSQNRERKIIKGHRLMTEELRNKISNSKKGHLVSEETRKKISINCGARRQEVKDKIRIANTGRKMSEDEKRMRSERAKKKGTGLWMKQVWAEGRASPNSLKGIGKNVIPYWKGKNLPIELRKKMGGARKKSLLEGRTKIWNKGLLGFGAGEKNNFWRGGISFEPYNKDFNKLFKINIRKRDNYVCMNCGIHSEKLNEALNVHHINYDKKLSILENCISLCNKCHGFTNINREYWTKLFQSLLTKRYGYNYSDEFLPIIKIEGIQQNGI